MVDLYGEGLERIFAALAEADGRRRAAAGRRRGRRQPDADPRPLPGRARAAGRRGARQRAPYMESHGGDVELLGIEDGIARLRLRAAATAAPPRPRPWAGDQAGARRGGARPRGAGGRGGAGGAPAAGAGSGGLELPIVSVAPGAADATPAWFDLDGGRSTKRRSSRHAAGIGGCSWRQRRGQLLAFREPAPAAARARRRTLIDGRSVCAPCGRGYYLPAPALARRRPLQLEPVPLLDDRAAPGSLRWRA